jgi:hypothetical protein
MKRVAVRPAAAVAAKNDPGRASQLNSRRFISASAFLASGRRGAGSRFRFHSSGVSLVGHAST